MLHHEESTEKPHNMATFLDKPPLILPPPSPSLFLQKSLDPTNSINLGKVEPPHYEEGDGGGFQLCGW